MEDPRELPRLNIAAANAQLGSTLLSPHARGDECPNDLFELRDPETVGAVLQHRRRSGHAYTWLGAGAVVSCGSGRTSLYTDATIARYRQQSLAALSTQPHLYALAEEIARDNQHDYTLMCLGSAAIEAQSELLRYLSTADSVAELGQILIGLFCGNAASISLLYMGSVGAAKRQYARWTLHPPPYSTQRAVRTLRACLPAEVGASIGLETHGRPEQYAAINRAFLAFRIAEEQQRDLWRTVHIVSLLQDERKLGLAAELMQLPRATLKFPQVMAQRIYALLLRWLMRQLNHLAAMQTDLPRRTVWLWCEPNDAAAAEYTRQQLLDGVTASHLHVLRRDGVVTDYDSPKAHTTIQTPPPSLLRTQSPAMLCEQQIAASPILAFLIDQPRSRQRSGRSQSMYNLQSAATAARAMVANDSHRTVLEATQQMFADTVPERRRWIVALDSPSKAAAYCLADVIRARPILCARRTSSIALPAEFGQRGCCWRWLTLQELTDYEALRIKAALCIQRWWRACLHRFRFLEQRGAARLLQHIWRQSRGLPLPIRERPRPIDNNTYVSEALCTHFADEYRWECAASRCDNVPPLSAIQLTMERALSSTYLCTAQIGRLYWATIVCLRLLHYAGCSAYAQRSLVAAMQRSLRHENALVHAQLICVALAWSSRFASQHDRSTLICAISPLFHELVHTFTEPLARAAVEAVTNNSDLQRAKIRSRLLDAYVRLHAVGDPLNGLLRSRVTAAFDRALCVRLRPLMTCEMALVVSVQMFHWTHEIRVIGERTDAYTPASTLPLLHQLVKLGQLNTQLPEYQQMVAPSLSAEFLHDGSCAPPPVVGAEPPGNIAILCAPLVEQARAAFAATPPSCTEPELRAGY